MAATFTFKGVSTSLASTQLATFRGCLANGTVISANETVLRQLDEEADITRAAALIRLSSRADRDLAKALVKGPGVKTCMETSLGLKDFSANVLDCDIVDPNQTCQQTSTLFALIATRLTPATSRVEEVVACSLASQYGTSAPPTDLPKIERLPGKPEQGVCPRCSEAESVLRGYGDRREWYTFVFCGASPETDASSFLNARNNSQGINFMCGSGGLGVVGVSIMSQTRLNTIATESPDGSCSAFVPSLLGNTVPVTKPKSKESGSLFTELYFIIPVAVGGAALVVVVALGAWFWCQPSVEVEYEDEDEDEDEDEEPRPRSRRSKPSKRLKREIPKRARKGDFLKLDVYS